MIYNLAQRILPYLFAFKWRLWTRHEAMEISYMDPEAINIDRLMQLHELACNASDILLASRLEAMLNENGLGYVSVGDFER